MSILLPSLQFDTFFCLNCYSCLFTNIFYLFLQCMQLLRRYITLTLALLITLSATGVNVSVHRCCGKIKNFTLFGDSKVCSMDHMPKRSSCSTKQPGSLAVHRHSCCNNQRISVHNDLQASVQKGQTTEKHVQPLIINWELFKSWIGTDELPVFRLKPYLIHHLKDPLIILFRQFRI